MTAAQLKQTISQLQQAELNCPSKQAAHHIREALFDLINALALLQIWEKDHPLRHARR